MKKELYTVCFIVYEQSEREMIRHSNCSIVNPRFRAIRIFSIVLIVSVFASLVLIPSGKSAELVTFKVVPQYSGVKKGEAFNVQIRAYGADYIDLTEIYTWQVRVEWNPAVLDMDPTIIWGDFLDGPRIGPWGIMTMNAPAGQKEVNVTDGFKYQAGMTVFIQDDLHSETKVIASVLGNQLTMSTNLVYSYTVAANGGCYPDPETKTSSLTDNTLGRADFGITSIGPAPGESGADGWLATLKFYVEQNTYTALSIDNFFTYLINTIGEVKGDDAGELIKINGHKAWDEDVSPNGIIGVNDLYGIAKAFNKCPIQSGKATATSGAWTGGANAYTPNNVFAFENTAGDAQIYTGWGIATAGWTGVSKVEIGLERKTLPGGDDKVIIAVSNNNGGSFSGTDVTVVVTENVDTFTWYDFTAAYSWTATGVQQIAVRLTYGKTGGTGTSIYVDWVAVRVTPTPLAGNSYCDVTKDGVVNAADLIQLLGQYGQTYGI